MRNVYVLIVFISFCYRSIGQVSLTNGSPTATIDFSNTTSSTVGTNPTSAFAGTGFEPNPTTAGMLNSNAWAVTGWSNGDLSFGGTRTTAATDYTRGVTALAVTTGGMYSFTGLPGSVANPSLMIQPGGSDFAPGTLTLRVLNNGTSAITDIALSYNLYIRNDQGRSNSFNFSYSTDDITYIPVAALDYTSIATLDGLGWVLVGTAPSRNTTITGLSIGTGSYFYIRWSGADVGGSGSRDEFGLDDINMTATFAPPNTITTGTITGAPFTLADCSATGSGSVAFTTTDVYLAGNTFTAQMSNDIGSFASPITLGSISLSGTAPSGSIPITIPAGTAPGVGYLIRVVSNSPVVTGSSVAFQIIQNGPGGCQSSHTDYYRSVQTGNWGTLSTWESSNDNSTFIPATLVPTSVANTILITSGHTVTIAGAASADQLTIPSGATLVHSSGIFTVADGAGDDIYIQSGGVFELSSTANAPTFANATAVCNVSTGSILRVAATGLTGSGVAVNSNNFVYQHQSVLEYTISSAFTTGGTVVYFPNVNSTTIPIFRANNAGSITVGAGTVTTFNGVFECNGGGVVWQNAGNKVFRNGIIGTGNMSTLVSFTGDLIINGATADLGGSGTIDLTNSPGSALEIGTTSVATMTSSKTIIGDVTLLANSYVNLGVFNLTISGAVTGGTTNYIRTNSTGALILNNITGARNAPIGNSTYNPLTITNTSGHNWTLRVEDVLAVADPTFLPMIIGAVQREWHITPSTNPPLTGADIVFEYNDGDPTQIGTSFVTTSNVQVWHEVVSPQPWGTDWLAAGVAQTATGTPGGVRTASISNWTWFSPFAVSTISFPLPIKLISFNAVKVNDRQAWISWELAACCSKDARFELEKSTNDGRTYQSVATVGGSETNRFYSYQDTRLGSGITYYRLKATDVDGKIVYSRVVAIINGGTGLLLTGIYPNPVKDEATITVTAAKKTMVQFRVFNLSGQVVKQWMENAAEGTNTISADLARLPAGTYHLVAEADGLKSVLRLMKQ